MLEITSFLRFRETLVTGPGPFKSTPDPKIVCYTPREQPKNGMNHEFLRFRETRVTGPGPFKSTSDPKTVCYSPRKRPEMAEIASFL